MSESKNISTDQDSFINAPPFSSEQQAKIDNLSDIDKKTIDDTLLSNTSYQWRKVARVVASTMNDLENSITGIPDIYYAKRVIELADKGLIESQGNLTKMRFSEIRLVKQIKAK